MLGDFALLIALYTVASREDRRTAITAAAILEFGVILALVRWFRDAHIRSFVGLTGWSRPPASSGRTSGTAGGCSGRSGAG